jgi:hypothetical protein
VRRYVQDFLMPAGSPTGEALVASPTLRQLVVGHLGLGFAVVIVIAALVWRSDILQALTRPGGAVSGPMTPPPAP